METRDHITLYLQILVNPPIQYESTSENSDDPAEKENQETEKSKERAVIVCATHTKGKKARLF